MSAPTIPRPDATLSLIEKMQVIRIEDAGIIPLAISNQLVVTKENVCAVINNWKTVERVERSPKKCQNLTLNDEYRVLHFMDIHGNASEVGHICNI